MSDKIQLNVQHIESIRVHDGDDNPVTGLVQGDFGITQSLNGVASSLTITVTEVDYSTNPGEYSVSFTPDTLGTLVITIRQTLYEPMGWEGEYQVVAYDPDNPTDQDELVPQITSSVATDDSVEVAFVGAKGQTYSVTLTGTGVEDTETRVGGGNVTLTPTSSGSKTVTVVGVDGTGAEVTDSDTLTVVVPT
jgi:hypothetical protein